MPPPCSPAQVAANADFAAWVRQNTHPHKQPGYISAVVSLKPIGGIPGDATDAQMDAVADLADRYSFDEVRVSHVQNLVLPHVRQDELFQVWQALVPLGLATPNIGTISDIIACPGLDYCASPTRARSRWRRRCRRGSPTCSGSTTSAWCS